jgi:uncharacterized membrane protein
METNKKSLTWKYFWEQKSVELSKGFIILAALILIPLMIGSFVGDDSALICGDDQEIVQECGQVYQWFKGLFALFFLFIVGALLFLIGMVIWDWINDNWERASERADEEIKRRKKK